jgi:hypothetical protein
MPENVERMGSFNRERQSKLAGLKVGADRVLDSIQRFAEGLLLCLFEDFVTIDATADATSVSKSRFTAGICRLESD